MKTSFTCWRFIRATAAPTLLLGSWLASQPAAAQECEVKLGVVGPMTGGGAAWGLSEKGAVEFEAAWTNANGGVVVGGHKCKVTVITVDDQSSVTGAAAASDSLASQNVHAVVGPITSPEVAGWHPVGKRNSQVFFTTTFKADAITPDFPLGFHNTQTPPIWGPLVIKALKDRFDAKTAVVVGPNDSGGTDPGNQIAKMFNEAGVTATTEWYQRGTTNFAPIALRLIAAKPDIIDVGPMPPGEAGLLGKQLLEAGFTGAFGKLGAGAEPIIDAVGGLSALKAFYWFDHIPTQDPAAQKLKADYESLMKTRAPVLALWMNQQVSAELLLKAISAAGTDRDGEKIADELRKMTPESRYFGKAGWRGMKQYGINQEFSFPVGLNIVSNGKMDPQIKIEVPAEPQN